MTTPVTPITLDAESVAALRRLIEYMVEAEADDYEDTDPADAKDHPYHDAVVLARLLDDQGGA